ncbi:MAG: hypothetical protein JSS23_12260 [Proteobacteria bacterium]|nr:hypothetical protein [Pseudomonadota bacterium]
MKRMISRLRQGPAGVRAWYGFWRWRRAWARQVAMPWPVPPQLPEGEQWTNADAAVVDAFFRTDTGRRALQSLQRMEYDTALQACTARQPGTTREYAAGYACGFRCCAAYLMTLSAERTDSAQPVEGDSSEAAIRDRYSL